MFLSFKNKYESLIESHSSYCTKIVSLSVLSWAKKLSGDIEMFFKKKNFLFAPLSVSRLHVGIVRNDVYFFNL